MTPSGQDPVTSLGAGEAGALIAAVDWAATPLGPPSIWPRALRTLVEVILGATEPMFVVWGPRRTLIYNNPYVEVLAAKHPAMGADFLEVWSEIRGDLEPLVARAYAGGAHSDEIALLMERKGYPEPTWWHYSYTPIRDDSGAYGGFLCACRELTAQIVSERRQTLLLGLDEKLRATASPQEALDAACEALGRGLDGALALFTVMGEAIDDVEVIGQWRAVQGPSPRGRHRLGAWAREDLEGLRSPGVLMVEDISRLPEASPAVRASFDALGSRASLSVPLIRNGRVQARLGVHAAKARVWSPEDVDLAQAVLERAWHALERARAETALRESEERLRLATQAADVGFWDVDVVNDVLHWPPILKGMFGLPADAPVTLDDFFRALHPEDLEPVATAYAAAQDADLRALYDVEYRTIGLQDGVLRWVAAKGRGIFDDQRRCVRVIGTAIDITRRKADEARLRELNETLERRVAETAADLDRVWRNASDAFIVVDKAGRLRRINPATRDILGWSDEELVGASIFDFVHPDDRADTEGALAQLRTGVLPTFENRYRTKEGGWRRLAWVASPEGDLIYAYGRDVTEERERQAQLEAAQAALRQAQKMEAVGQLTGGIAHDFNNLLQGVAGSLELILRRPSDPEKVERWARAGLEAAERGARLTGQLLAFSRAQKIEVAPVDVSELVLGFREMLDRTLGAHIRIDLDLEPGSALAMGDAVQIEMAVLNLALNARDAMGAGGVLTLTTRRVALRDDPELEDGDYVELAVRDTGHGMDPEVAARAFDPFFTTKETGKGTGLGLSQVYGFARQAGGAVRLDTTPGAGTVVRLLLRGSENGVAGRARESLAPQAAQPSLARVLVIDDDADVRRFLIESLDALGFEAIEAVDGPAGLAAVDTTEPDLVILDFAMPGMNGAEVAQRLWRKRPSLPIVFATGFADSQALDAVAGESAPILRKPFGLGDLQRTLAQALEAAPPPASLDRKTA